MCVTCIQFRFRWARTWWESTTPIKGHSKIWFINGRRHVLFSLFVFSICMKSLVSLAISAPPSEMHLWIIHSLLVSVLWVHFYSLSLNFVHFALESDQHDVVCSRMEQNSIEYTLVHRQHVEYLREMKCDRAVDWDAVGTQCVSVHICAIRELAVVRSLAEINKIQFAKQ